jgi:hypothetical protein
LEVSPFSKLFEMEENEVVLIAPDLLGALVRGALEKEICVVVILFNEQCFLRCHRRRQHWRNGYKSTMLQNRE